MKLLCFIAAATLFFSSAAYSQKVAIFDYDDRLDKPDTVAKHLEKKLLEAQPSLKITHFSGKEKQSVAIKVLEKLDTQNFDVIVTLTSDALIVAQHMIKKTPVVFTNANNPLFLGFKSLSGSGKNFAGATYYVPIEDQFRLYKQMTPKLKTVGILFDKNNKSRQVEVRECRTACSKLNLKFMAKVVDNPKELDKAVQSLIAGGAQAIVATSSGTIYNNIPMFKSQCVAANIPIFSFNKKGVGKGAVAALANDHKIIAEELVVPMVLGIISGELKVASIPVAFGKTPKLYFDPSVGAEFGVVPEKSKLLDAILTTNK